ncbi:MAG: hypothetical protein ACYDCL_23355 [Myxococcales bacterium]
MASRHNAVPRDLERKLAALVQIYRHQLSPGLTMNLLGKQTTPAQFVAQLEAVQALFRRVDQAKVAYDAALRARTAQMPRAVDLVAHGISMLHGVLGRNAPILQVVGLRPHGGPRPLDSAAGALKHARQLETRRRFGTMGKRQKQKVKAGDVEVTIRDGKAQVREKGKK